MERQIRPHASQARPAHNSLPPSGSLDQQRSEVEDLLRASDRAFDAINHIQAHQYLEQNLQAGGQ